MCATLQPKAMLLRIHCVVLRSRASREYDASHSIADGTSTILTRRVRSSFIVILGIECINQRQTAFVLLPIPC